MCECISSRRQIRIDDDEKKKADAETVLKTEKLSSLIDLGILTPCFNADSTSSFESPLPDNSFSWRIRHSLSAILDFLKSDFLGKEKGEKLLGDSSKERREFPLKMFIITPWAILMLHPNFFFIDLRRKSFVLPWEEAWKKSLQSSVGMAEAISPFSDDAFRMSNFDDSWSLLKPFFNFPC